MDLSFLINLLVALGIQSDIGFDNSALTLINASDQYSRYSKHMILSPSKTVVETHLKDHSFQVGDVRYDLNATIESDLNVNNDVYPILIKNQLEKAFASKGLAQGVEPVCRVNIVINAIRLLDSLFLPSILHIRMEVETQNEIIMMGELESRHNELLKFAWPSAWSSMSKLIPATAVSVAEILEGLKSGNVLSDIEVYPSMILQGTIIVPDFFLKDNSYGLKELTDEDITKVKSNLP